MTAKSFGKEAVCHSSDLDYICDAKYEEEFF